jgi:ubiquinone/menaquinone biosynthesis C-methylase UbiE
VWDDHVVPRLTDLSLRGHEVGEWRGAACAGLTGRVLELGFGTGLNVRWYPSEVTSVTAIEPSDVGWRMSEKRRARTSVPIERAGLDGQDLDLPDDSHDSVLVTFSLCTIPDPLRALREARRVVRDGGRLHALEHGLAPDEGVRRWQRRLEPLQKAVAGGCHLTRDVPAMVAEAGWEIEEVEQEYAPGPACSHAWAFGTRLRAV